MNFFTLIDSSLTNGWRKNTTFFFVKKKKVKTTKLLNRKAENHKESLAQIKLMLEIWKKKSGFCQ